MNMPYRLSQHIDQDLYRSRRQIRVTRWPTRPVDSNNMLRSHSTFSYQTKFKILSFKSQTIALICRMDLMRLPLKCIYCRACTDWTSIVPLIIHNRSNFYLIILLLHVYYFYKGRTCSRRLKINKLSSLNPYTCL